MLCALRVVCCVCFVKRACASVLFVVLSCLVCVLYSLFPSLVLVICLCLCLFALLDIFALVVLLVLFAFWLFCLCVRVVRVARCV